MKVEKSILPLYNSTQVLNRRGNSKLLECYASVPFINFNPDIESALQKIDEVASNQEGIAAEEALILRGYARMLCECNPFLYDMKAATWAARSLQGCTGTIEHEHRVQVIRSGFAGHGM